MCLPRRRLFTRRGTKRSRRWHHIDMTGMRMTRWGMTIMSKMVYLNTLVLDNCDLE